MWHCVLSGGRALPRMWAVIGGAYAVGVAMAGLFGVAAWLWLAEALDGSLATRTLLAAADANVFVDLLMHHGESLRTLGVTAAILLVLGTLAGIWTNAAMVAAAAGARGARPAFRRGWGLLPVFLRLWLLAGPLAIGVAAAIGIGGKLLLAWAAGRGFALPPLAVLGGGFVLAGGSLLVLAAVHDHARLRSAVRPGTGAVQAYAWAWGFVWRRGTQALPLAAVLGLMAVLVWGCGVGVRHAVPTVSGAGVAVALIIGQLAAVAGAGGRGGRAAAEAALQQRHGAPDR